MYYRVKVCWLGWETGALVPWYRGAVPVVEDSHSHQQTRPSSAVTATLSVNTPDNRHQTPDTLPVMSEDHFDQYEYYNFEEKLLSSRNTGTSPTVRGQNTTEYMSITK